MGPRADLTMVGNKITAGRDNNIQVTVNDSPTLPELYAILNPVAATYDSYTSTNNRRSQCFEGTRKQLLSQIHAWIAGQGNRAPIYVLDGVAGIGKSTVAHTIAKQAHDLGILGASFIFARDEDLRKTARNLISTIAYQLACFEEAIAKQIAAALKDKPHAASKELPAQFLDLIRKPFQELPYQKQPPILIVIDALDECDEEDAKTILNLLLRYIPGLPRLKIFMTTRPEWHIRNVLDHTQNHERFHLHEIEDSVVQTDVQLYLNFYLSPERVQKQFPHRHLSWQPDTDRMEMLRGVCGTLFIIASTATKFILDPKRSDPEKQLTRLLEGVSPTDYRGSNRTDAMDRFYIQILRAAMPEDVEDDDDWIYDYKTIVGAILVLQDPLPCRVLAALLGVNPDKIEDTLLHLHSLVAPSGPNLVFRIHHKSFPDFITSKDRIEKVQPASLAGPSSFPSIRFLIDEKTHHLQIAKGCFRVMSNYLKRNIADLSPQDWYKDLSELGEKSLHSAVSDGLAYAGVHWASHLLAAGQVDEEVQSYITDWTTNQICFWLELMSILRQIENTDVILEKALNAIDAYAGSWPEQAQIRELLADTRQLVQWRYWALRSSPLHVYWSGLPFLPKGSALCRAYYRAGAGMVQVLVGFDEEWPPTGSRRLFYSSSALRPVAISADRSTLASPSPDAQAEDGQRHDHIGNGDEVRLWDGKTGAHIATSDSAGHGYVINSIALSSDGSRLATASSTDLKAISLRLWDGRTGALIANLDGHSDIVSTLTFSTFDASETRLASGSWDHTVRLWDGRTGAHIATLNGHTFSVRSLAFSTNGSRLASGSVDRTVRLWDGKTGARITTLEGHPRSVTSLAFSPDGSILASAASFREGRTVRLWNCRIGAHIAMLSGHDSSVKSVVFSNDGSRLASIEGKWDRAASLRLWDSKTGTHIATFDGDAHGIAELRAIAFQTKFLAPAPAARASQVTLLMLVRRSIGGYGLVSAMLMSDGTWVTTPFCWFPPHFEAIRVSDPFNPDSGAVAFVYEGGVAVLLDISQAFS